jgi:dihydroorotase
MNTLIKNGRVIDPSSQTDQVADVAISDGAVVAIGAAPSGFVAERTMDASGCWVLPGLVDLSVRLFEPGDEHAGMLESELKAAVSAGVTSLACPPDTDPVLDEPGLVRMLHYKARQLNLARVFPIGALTVGLKGEMLTEMAQLAKSGCVGLGQADVPLTNTQFLLRAFQYASTFDQTVWLRATDPYLGRGAAASGALATRLGLSGTPAMAETIALYTLIELVRATHCRLHVCKVSTEQGVALIRSAKQEGLPISCDVSMNSLLLTDMDIGFFDSRARLDPPLRQNRDREALQKGLADGTIDALVSDHHPLPNDLKAVPFDSAAPGATGVELLLSLALKWSAQSGTALMRAVESVTHSPARILGHGRTETLSGRLQVGAPADLCLVDPRQFWTVQTQGLVSQGKSTPFEGYELPGRVLATLVNGRVVFERTTGG